MNRSVPAGAFEPGAFADVACACGFAKDGLLPQHLCRGCGDLLLRRWQDEERAVLQTVPAYAWAVGEVLCDVHAEQTQALGGVPARRESAAAAARRSGGHRLAQLSVRYRREREALELDRWQSFADLLRQDQRASLTDVVRHAGKWGPGSADLADLARQADVALVASGGRTARRRPYLHL